MTAASFCESVAPANASMSHGSNDWEEIKGDFSSITKGQFVTFVIFF